MSRVILQSGGVVWTNCFRVAEALAVWVGFPNGRCIVVKPGKLMRTKVGRRTMVRESELARVVKDGGKSPSVGRHS